MCNVAASWTFKVCVCVCVLLFDNIAFIQKQFYHTQLQFWMTAAMIPAMGIEEQQY